jgi:hypothetical protein
MKHLILLAGATTTAERCAIAHLELSKVTPHRFIKQYKLKNIDVELVSVGCEESLLKVVVRAWCNGVEVAVDNPLYYHNAPMMVSDGTFETVLDEETKLSRLEPNFVENPEEALRIAVFETLKVTALKGV